MINRFVLTLALAIACQFSFGQNLGKNILGGTFMFQKSGSKHVRIGSNSDPEKYDQQTIVNILPSYAGMVGGRTAIGFQTGYSFIKFEDSGFDTSLKLIPVSIFARMHYRIFEVKSDDIVTNQLLWYLQPSFTKSFILGLEDDDITRHNIATGVSAGLLFFVSPKIALDLDFLRFTWQHQSAKSETFRSVDNTVTIESLFSGSSLGIRFYL